MKKRISLIFLSLILVLTMSILPVAADAEPGSEDQEFQDSITALWESAEELTEESLAEAIILDSSKSYKITPANDMDTLTYAFGGIVEVYERDYGIWSLTPITYTTYGPGDGNNLYSLSAGKDYCIKVYGAMGAPYIKKVECVNLTFDANGGQFTDQITGAVTDKKVYKHQIDAQIIGNPLSPSPDEREAYTFRGWNTKPDGSGAYFTQYSSFTKDLTFYAVWAKQITITVKANGGVFLSRKINPETDDYDRADSLDIPASVLPNKTVNLCIVDYEPSNGFRAFPEREGFEIWGYNSKPDGSGFVYSDEYESEDFGPFSSDTTVYVIWRCKDNNHTYGDWKVTKAATSTAEGESQRVCSKCGYIQKKTLAIEEIMDLPSVKITKPAAGKKKVTVKWKKVSSKNLKKIASIQIQVATDKNFNNIVKSTNAGKKKTSKVIKGLKSKTKYYVRIRAYKSSGGAVHVSKWSAKSVKAK